ncbi:hypothetical protein AC249_AIPGENE14203 [Exaiptasia diaphana]|nr:hypothetical protein AC249_AIPGENE14203 [Exaiptasia diaphana]
MVALARNVEGTESVMTTMFRNSNFLAVPLRDVCAHISNTPEPSSEDRPRGWALKESKKGRRFSEKQKMYLGEMFDKGKRSGHKIDSTIVAKEMHFARDFDGNRKFQMSEFLTASQIQGYFTRKASKDRRGPNDTSQEENHRAAEEEEGCMLTRQIVLDECQLRHPIVYDSIDLCQLYSEGKLNKLSIALLQEICNNLEIDTSDVKVRCKAPMQSSCAVVYLELVINWSRTVHISLLHRQLYSVGILC